MGRVLWRMSCCCCFSEEPLSKEEVQKSGYDKSSNSGATAGKPHPYSDECHSSNKFQVAMKDAICQSPLCCILTCVTGTFGTNWCLRRQVIDKDWSKYYCCQGFAPCCQECLDGITPEAEAGRACCMCLECFCCPGLAISATRFHLMIEYALVPDPSDNQIIRFNNCMQCLACICDLLAICFEGLRDCARIVDCIAHIVFCMTAGCMAGQIDAEKSYQIEMEQKSLLGHPTSGAPEAQYDAVPAYSAPPPPPPPPNQHQAPGQQGSTF